MSRKVIIRSYPKTIFFYPTFLLTIVISVLLQFNILDMKILGVIFFVVFSLNFLIVSIEFTKNIFINMIIALIAMIFGGLWLKSIYPNFMNKILILLSNIEITMSEDFYYMMIVLMGSTFLIIMLLTRFEYCEITSNELILYSGLLSEVKRYPTNSLRYEQSVDDVFENILLKSGKLKLFISNEREPIILENVPFIKSKFKLLDEILSYSEVKVTNQTN